MIMRNEGESKPLGREEKMHPREEQTKKKKKCNKEEH